MSIISPAKIFSVLACSDQMLLLSVAFKYHITALVILDAFEKLHKRVFAGKNNSCFDIDHVFHVSHP